MTEGRNSSGTTGDEEASGGSTAQNLSKKVEQGQSTNHHNAIKAADDVRGTAIAKYFHQGYSYSLIVCFLEKVHGISISLRQLKRLLKKMNLRRQPPPLTGGRRHDLKNLIKVSQLLSNGLIYLYVLTERTGNFVKLIRIPSSVASFKAKASCDCDKVRSSINGVLQLFFTLLVETQLCTYQQKQTQLQLGSDVNIAFVVENTITK